ncbi:MAG: exonuclease domain-containing protein [Pseudobdellovibrionaceae bacterium]
MPESESDFSKPWTEFTFVAFDTETSGAYPLGSEVVEFGAVKWKGGQEIDSFQTLLRPSKPMSDFIISIHGITNEMVADAPLMSEKISQIHEFLKGSIPMAHHAPFDMGFMAVEFEKHNLPLPSEPVLCTSLLARKLITESPNHKLQTLIPLLKIDGGKAHRALDDARACLHVGLECMNRLGPLTPLSEVLKVVEKDLSWSKYSLLHAHNPTVDKVIECVQKNLHLDISYESSKSKTDTRRITPLGLVRNPDGDFVMATCHRDGAQKRFYLQKIKDAVVAY